MSAPLMVTDAGRGETPAVGNAKFKRGDVVKVRKLKALAHFPREAVVAVAIPPGFPSEYALADLVGEPRPLMITKAKNYISYILVNEGDKTPYLARESDLLESGKPPVEIGTCSIEKSSEPEAKDMTGSMFLLPPAKHLCQECAWDHPADQPHNKTLFYAVKFKMQHGREPTWKDCIAHCAEPVQAAWERELRKKGVWPES